MESATATGLSRGLTVGVILNVSSEEWLSSLSIHMAVMIVWGRE